jgi:RNA polymerase sigma-70 factor (ECF subfamily)
VADKAEEPGSSAERWLADARAGSQEALGQVLGACRAYLLLVAEREMGDALRGKAGASDLVQETLLEAVRDFDQFHGTTEEELLAWLRRLLLNNLTDLTRHYRESASRQLGREVPLQGEGSSAGPADHLADDLLSPSGTALAGERARAVQGALQRLPESYRQALLWRYQDGRSFEDIGQSLGLSPNGARKLLVRALRQVQEVLGEI